MDGNRPPGGETVQYEFMVPVYHEIVSSVPLEAVGSHGAVLLILIVAIGIFKFKLPSPKKHREE